MVKSFCISLFLLFTVSSTLFSRDFASWRKGDIAQASWDFITETKAELLERAKAVENFNGKKVDIKFVHNTNMDRKQKLMHDRFLKYRMTEKQIHEYVSPYLRELENNRAILATAEEAASKLWEEKNKKGEVEEDVTNEAKLYGTNIKSARLGVVLDNSHSMENYLPKLRKEISSKFKNSFFVEIYGSIIDTGFKEDLTKNLWFYISPRKDENPFLKKWYCQSYPLENAHYFTAGLEQGNVAAIAALAVERKVDTIYWFTDMKDKGNDRGEEVLAAILKKYKVKLYLHTVSNLPRVSVKKIIKETGGEVIRKRVN